jgi:hypothetical protein
VVVQEAGQDEVHAELAVFDDPAGDLLGGADQLRTEAVVVLDEVLERGVGPHPLLVRGGLARLLDRRAESLDGFHVCLGDDLAKRVLGLLLGVADDREAVQAEFRPARPARPARPVRAAGLGGDAAQVVEVLPNAVERLAVREVPVRQPAAVQAGSRGVPTLEDLGVRAARPRERLRLQAEVTDAVEVAGEVGLVLGPDPLQREDELGAAAVALVVLEPRLAELAELVLEPARDDVHGDSPSGQVVGGGNPLREHARMPEAGMHRGDQLQAFGREQQRQAEARGLVLILGAVARRVSDLAERVVEAGALCDPRELAVVRERPVGPLLDRARDQAAADVRHPVGEAQRLGRRIGGHVIRPPRFRVRCVQWPAGRGAGAPASRLRRPGRPPRDADSPRG